MKKKTPTKLTDADWLNIVEMLIAKHSTLPRKRGKYKGHSDTETERWIAELCGMCVRYISAINHGKTYDGNMAVASLLGRVLVVWYCNVHRAKGMDPNRPLRRRKVFSRLARYRGELVTAMSDDRIMGAVWGMGQQWNFPFGNGAKGGKFV